MQVFALADRVSVLIYSRILMNGDRPLCAAIRR